MTATITHMHAGLAAKMQCAVETHIGRYPCPPIVGVRYVASGVYEHSDVVPRGTTRRFAAFIVSHSDNAVTHPGALPDCVLVDIDEAEAKLVAIDYGIDVKDDYYIVEFPETDPLLSPTAGLPLAQAMFATFTLLQNPPRPSVRSRSPRHALLDDRNQEIMRTHIDRWEACWEGGLVRQLPYRAEVVERSCYAAIDYLEDDNLGAAEQCCYEAETEVLVFGTMGARVTSRPRKQKAGRK
jgi:hypothetical protein